MTAPLTYVTVRGTGETLWSAHTMLGKVSKLVEAQGDARFVDVDYPASIAVFNPSGTIGGPSEAASRRTGVNNLATAVRNAPGRVVISGYSLGALVVSDFLAEQKRGRFTDCYVSAAVNIANPARREFDTFGRNAHGYGLDGQRKRTTTPVYEIANPVDLITSAPANSPWRMFADKIRKFSFDDVDGWLYDMVEQLSSRQVIQGQHNVFEPGWWQAYRDAPAWLRGYALDGQHTTAYGERNWHYGNTPVTAIELAARAVCRYA